MFAPGRNYQRRNVRYLIPAARNRTVRSPPDVVVPDLSNVAERLSGRPAQPAARRLPESLAPGAPGGKVWQFRKAELSLPITP